jgi:multidrug transporter EmrE-like cation transporter
MSLKGFHIVFVTICTLLCLFLALWAFALAPERTAMTLAYGIVGICGVVLMPVYGVYFYRKIVSNHF